jgi:hypothetical protein
MLTYMCTQNTGCCKWFTAVYTFIRSFTTVYLKSKQRNTNSYGLSPLCTWIKTKKYTFIRSFTAVYLNQNKEIHIYTVFHRCVPESKQRKYTCFRSFTIVYLNQNKENTHLYGLSPLCTWIKPTKIHMYTVFRHCVPESKQRKYTFIRSFTTVYLNQSKENTHLYGLSPLCTWLKAKKIHMFTVFHHCVLESKQRNTHLYDLSPLGTRMKTKKYTFMRSFTTVYLSKPH